MFSAPSAPSRVPETRSVPLILHVTEAMGGGLESAVYDFIRSAPQYRHALLFTRRGAFETAETRPDNLVEVLHVGTGFRALHRAYGATVARLQPDVIHLHSAWAGLIGRTRSRGARDAAVVYSPHSFFFDRRDVSFALRLIARAVERVLLRRTDLLAAVSPAEAEDGRRMGGAAHYIPNVVRLPGGLRWAGGTDAPELVVVGRIAAQKDPDFMLEVVRHVRAHLSGIRWTWVGGGDEAAADRLRAAGVDVTGWVSRAECLERMSRASVYVHTAAWEGSPITLLEAAAMGVPIVARSIAALDSLGFDPGLRTPERVAAALLDMIAGRSVPIAPAAPAPDDQARALADAYRRVLPVPVPVPVPVPASAQLPVPARVSPPVLSSPSSR